VLAPFTEGCIRVHRVQGPVKLTMLSRPLRPGVLVNKYVVYLGVVAGELLVGLFGLLAMLLMV
jgi:hypothetical protein